MGRALLLPACIVALVLPSAGLAVRAESLDFVLRAARTPSSPDLARSIAIVKQRAELLGGTEIDVKQRSAKEISVHIGSVDNPARAKTLLASRGELAFYDFAAHVSGRPVRTPPKKGHVLRCGGGTAYCPGVSASPVKRWVYYAARGHPELTGTDLVRDRTRAEDDPVTGEPIVVMQFTYRGQLAFQRITAAEAKRGRKLWIRHGRGRASRYFQKFAIAIDDRLLTTPTIDFQQYPNGINAGNGIEITGLSGAAEAKGVALLLKSGTLPVPFSVQR